MSFHSGDERQTWIDGLKAGDEVIIEDRVQGVRKEKVIKRTPTKQVVVSWFKSEIRFSPFGVEKSNDPWHHKNLRPVTQHELDAIEKQGLLRALAGVIWGRQPLAKLRTIMGIVKADS